jgi:hypothetical protein
MNRRTFLGLAGATAVAQPFPVASETKKTMKITGVDTMCCVFLQARSTTTRFTSLARKVGASYYACRPMQALSVGRKAHSER